MGCLLPIENLPLATLATSPDGLEWSLGVVPRIGHDQLFCLWIRHGQTGRWIVGDRREIVSGLQAAKSLRALADALGVEGIRMSTDLMALADEKESELAEVDKEIATLTSRRQLLGLEAKEIRRAATRLAQLRQGGGLSSTKGDRAPSVKDRIVSLLEQDAKKKLRAREVAAALGLHPQAASVAMSTLATDGRIRRVDQGLYQAK